MGITYSISDLAKEFDLTTRAMRFYEDMGLLQPERSGPGGRQRVYSGRDRTRLKLTLRAKRLGLSLTEAKDPQSALALRTQFAQETSSRMMEAMRQMADLTAGAQAEFNKMLGQQMAGTSQEMMENFKKMMSVSGLPGGGQDAFATMQKAFGNAKDAFDQIAKASSTAFTMPGAGKGKSVKVE